MAGRREARLEAAIRLAVSRLRPFAEIHPYVAMAIDALAAAVEEREDRP